MNRANPADMRRALELVEAMKDAGVMFVPVPVFSDAEAKRRLKDVLGILEKMESVPGSQSGFVGGLRQQLLTQDGRCTADPFYVVFSKREIIGRGDYDFDRIVWRHDEGGYGASDHTSKRLELLHRHGREPQGWTRLTIREIDQFETACFTEQGCKDYLAVNGHNLRKPFIYVHSLYRNQEMLELRKMLMAEPKLLVVPEGWQLVPVEPTPEMSQAGVAAQAEKLKRYALGGSLPPIDHGIPDAYRAMLAAAPKPEGGAA